MSTRRFADRWREVRRTHLHPCWIIRQLHRDLRSLKEQRSIGDLTPGSTDEEMRARLLARFAIAAALAEALGTYVVSPVSGAVLQYAPFGSAQLGIKATIIGDFLGAIIAFDILWLLLNGWYFRSGRMARFVQDVAPLHLYALMISLPLYLVEWLAGTASVAALALLSESAARLTPTYLYCFALNTAVELLYVGAAAPLLTWFPERVLPGYRAYLCRREEK